MTALALRSFHKDCNSIWSIVAANGGNGEEAETPWYGTNRGWPLQDNSAAYSSAAQSIKGKVGSIGSAKAKRDKNADAAIAGTLEITYAVGSSGNYVNVPSYNKSARKIFLSQPYLDDKPFFKNAACTPGFLKFTWSKSGTHKLSFMDDQSETLFVYTAKSTYPGRSHSPFTKAGFKDVATLVSNFATYHQEIEEESPCTPETSTSTLVQTNLVLQPTSPNRVAKRVEKGKGKA